MTFNATPPTQTYTYDQENHLTGAAGYTYTYDGDGNRVRKSNGNTASSGTLYWYMTPGIVAETDLAGTLNSEYIFFDGERVARRDGPTGAGGVFYYFSDHLKTASVITNSAGVIVAESDYYPWGGELQFVANDSNHYKFTGKERDAESGLDNFGARYYSNGLGRFITTDSSDKSINKFNPQSWNRYNYTLSNPLRYIDHNGKWPTEIHERIIDRAFPGLSQAQRQELKRTSSWVDRAAAQTKAHNHEHAMKSPGEDPAVAKRAIDQNIQNHEQAAQRAQGSTPEHANQINDHAMNEFGQALHTVEDRTSRAHTDANGNPHDWNGIPNPFSNADKIAVDQHEAEEATITPEQMNNSVQAARDAFEQTFGQNALQEAVTPPPPPKQKEPK